MLLPSCPLGVPEKPEIDGFVKPALEGDKITLTCITQGSKPAADLRWFRNEKEIKGESSHSLPLPAASVCVSPYPYLLTHVTLCPTYFPALLYYTLP